MTVRVRFAPSPTGSLHIGSVRTILYDYFFARQNGGALILRIEDTDQDRLVAGAIDSIYDGLLWLGIKWDEGPREGGPHAPYIQSERLALYRGHAEKLIASAHAYYCFCSKERLAEVRRQQEQRRELTRYDRLCRRIAPAEAAERAKGEPHVIRLKVPDGETLVLDDLVYGRVEWSSDTIEDQVLLKSDGYPTYHLAVVVDDHVMGITHVMRAEDWLPSTPKHILLYRYLGWTMPPHAHLPNVLGPDGRKLSKRHGATAVSQFRADGYLPEALINYLALLGWASGTEEEVFSLDDLVHRWRLEHVQKSGAKWDKERLDFFNGIWIRKLSVDELVTRLEPFVPAEWDRELLRRIAPHIQERIKTLKDAAELVAFLFTDDLAYDAKLLVPKKQDPAGTVELLSKATVVLRYLDPFVHDRIETALKGIAAEIGWKQGDVNLPVRVAVTGRTVGPPLYESLEVLGKERALERIDRAIDALGKANS